ncbi:MAG: c-type cytochrome [Acidobacteria bacterium]|nr:c-type cytochrome [Acidobacteriota bacterium]
MRSLFVLAALPVFSFAQAPAAVEAGRQLYLGSCSACHGANGEGSQGPGLMTGRITRLADSVLHRTIKNGLPGTMMPGSDLPDSRITEIAAFLRSLTAPAISANVAGDAPRGRSLFFGSARCSSCHMILGEGGYPGPDLSNIGAERTVGQLRDSLLKPSARVAPGYRAASVTLPSGETISGVAKNHNNYTVHILDSKGRLHLLDRARLSTLQLPDASLMPAAEPADVPDLIAFLARQSTRSTGGAQ